MATDQPLLASWRRLAVIAVASVFTITAYSQSGVTPPAGDPQVFSMFLRSYDSMVCSVAQSGFASAAAGSIPLLRRLKISLDDRRIICEVSASLRQDEDAILRDASAYNTQAIKSGLRPEMDVDRGFQNRRLAARRGAMAGLATRLSPAGRAAVFNYVDGEFRASVRRARLQ